MTARGFGRFLARRDALAIMLAIVLWCIGAGLRPDYWWNLPNSFALLLNYTEVALIAIGLTYVIAAGDIDLSVGSVIALAAGTSAFAVKALGLDPATALVVGLCADDGGRDQRAAHVASASRVYLDARNVYVARGAAAWVPRPASPASKKASTVGRKIATPTFSVYPSARLACPGNRRAQRPTLWMVAGCHSRGIVIAYMPFGQSSMRPAQPARRRLFRHQHQARPLHRHGVPPLCATMAV